MKKLLWGALLASAVGAAQPATAETGDGWQIAITPRVQYLFLDFNASITAPSHYEESQFPFYGGSIEVTPPWWRNTSFLVTVLNGSDSNLGFSQNGVEIGRSEFHRLDIEALLRHRIQGTNFSVFAGFRYIRQRVKTNLTAPGFIFFDTGTPTLDNRITFYLGEVGAGLAQPLDARGEHSLFANGTIGVGGSRAVDNRVNGKPFHLFAVIFDVNAGYNWQFSSCCAFQARYRAFTFPAGNKTFKDLAVAHGPEVGFTFRFGL